MNERNVLVSPHSVSSPATPLSVSEPVPPYRLLVSGLPLSVSLPLPPDRFSTSSPIRSPSGWLPAVTGSTSGSPSLLAAQGLAPQRSLIVATTRAERSE